MAEVNVNIKDMAVAIGMPIYGAVPAGTAMSLFKTVQAATAAGVRLDYITYATSYVHISRNWIADEFLRSSCQKLFFIDQDVTWEPEAFFRMLALSTKYEVVGGTYPIKKDGPITFYLNATPGMPCNEHQLFSIDGMGLGFTVIDRAVMERLAAIAPQRRNPNIPGKSVAAIFRVDDIDGQDRGEDNAFYADVKALGIDVWLDPTVTLGHIGQREWRACLADGLKKQRKADASDENREIH